MLYESCNVEPVAALMGRVLKHGGVVVLADPPERNRANRLELLRRLEEGSDLVLEEQHTRAVRLEDKGHDVVLLRHLVDGIRRAEESMDLILPDICQD